jgi:hypothetical protein
VTDTIPVLTNGNVAWLYNNMSETTIGKSGVLKPGPIKKGE